MLNFALLSGSKGGVVTPGVAAAAFLARTSGLDTLHTNMYATLINGLVSDGVWPKLDCLYLFATKDSTTSLLNLCSSSFPCTAAGSPAFVADQGYTGVDASGTVYLSTGFNPSTAGGNYSQNSAHLSVWCNADVASTASGGIAIGNTTTSGDSSQIFPRFSDGKAYYRVNDANGASAPGITTANAKGFYVANRNAASGTTSLQGYKSASDQGVVAGASGAMSNAIIAILGVLNASGVHSTGFGGQLSVASIGGALSSTDVTNFSNRLTTARTTLGLS